MKLRIEIDADVPRSIAATIKRSGFTLCRDGSGMQIKVQNAAPIPSRKVAVRFQDGAEKPAE